MNYRTHKDLSNLIRKNLHLIPRLPILGIPRSGMIVASQIATHLDLPLVGPGEVQIHRDLLLVDDSISGGETMARVKGIFAHMKINWTTLAVYRKPNSPPVDIWFEEIPKPRIFEWNWHKHAYMRKAVCDIDGVLCTETSPGDRGNALPRWIPKHTVMALATGRHEYEREQTVAWLAKHGVRYKHLFMSNETQGARITKLKAAQEVGATWIVESNERQASWLKHASGLPVLCTDLNRMF